MIKRMKSNTICCVDVKTFLHKDPVMKAGKPYVGVLTQDGADHLRFEEGKTVRSDYKRNPHVFEGDLITVTKRDNGSYRINYKDANIGSDLSVDGYAIMVCNEIREAFKGLVEGKVFM